VTEPAGDIPSAEMAALRGSHGYGGGVSTAGSVRLDVSEWKLLGEEPDGLSEHPWLTRPGDDQHWLYKPVELKAENRQREDWAEKIVSEIGALLGSTRRARRFGFS
jgi:hypothetical protein